MTANDRPHDEHLAGWLKAKFNLTVQWNDMNVSRSDRYVAFLGDWDLDIRYATNSTIYGAALEYAACYNVAMFDELVNIELGAV